jgi:hypothetical protein
MKGYDDLRDDRRADAEWAVNHDELKRIAHDKNRSRGISPPPKGMGRKTATIGSKAIGEQLWGWWGESTMDFEGPDSIIKDGDSCPEGPNCKFRGKREEKGVTVPKVSRSKGKKEKKAAKAPSLISLFDRHSPDPGKDEAPPSPSTSSEGEGTESKDGTCDEERTFLVRVRAGMAEAEVLFLNNVRADGYEGPFDLQTPL